MTQKVEENDSSTEFIFSIMNEYLSELWPI